MPLFEFLLDAPMGNCVCYKICKQWNEYDVEISRTQPLAIFPESSTRGCLRFVLGGE